MAILGLTRKGRAALPIVVSSQADAGNLSYLSLSLLACTIACSFLGKLLPKPLQLLSDLLDAGEDLPAEGLAVCYVQACSSSVKIFHLLFKILHVSLKPLTCSIIVWGMRRQFVLARSHIRAVAIRH